MELYIFEAVKSIWDIRDESEVQVVGCHHQHLSNTKW